MFKIKIYFTLILLLVNIVSRYSIIVVSANDYDADDYEDLETSETKTDITNIEPPQVN